MKQKDFFFDGKPDSSRRSAASSKKKELDDRKAIIEFNRKNRELRERERNRQKAAKVILTFYKKYRWNLQFDQNLRNLIDQKVARISQLKSFFLSKNITYEVPVPEIASLIQLLFNISSPSFEDIYRKLIVVQFFLESNKAIDYFLFFIGQVSETTSICERINILRKFLIFALEILLKINFDRKQFAEVSALRGLDFQTLELSIYKIFDFVLFDKIHSKFQPDDNSFIKHMICRMLSETSCEILMTSHSNSLLSQDICSPFLNQLVNVVVYSISSPILSPKHETIVKYFFESIENYEQEPFLNFSRNILSIPNFASHSIMPQFFEPLLDNDVMGLARIALAISSSKFFLNTSASNDSTNKIVTIQKTGSSKKSMQLHLSNSLASIRIILSSLDQPPSTARSGFSIGTLSSNPKSKRRINTFERIRIVGNTCAILLRFLSSGKISKSVLQDILCFSDPMAMDIVTETSIAADTRDRTLVQVISETLRDVPLTSFLYYMNGGDDITTSSSSNASASGSGGLKGLESQLIELQFAVLTGEETQWQAIAQDATCLENMLNFFSHKYVLSSFLDSIPLLDNNTTMNGTAALAAYKVICDVRLCSQLIEKSPFQPRIGSKAVLLDVMAFSIQSISLVTRLWRVLKTVSRNFIVRWLCAGDAVVGGRYAADIEQAATGFDTSASELISNFRSTMHLFCVVFTRQLEATNDLEFFIKQTVLSIEEVREAIDVLRECLYTQYWTNGSGHKGYHANDNMEYLPKRYAKCYDQVIFTKIFNKLHARNERNKFVEDKQWHWPTIVLGDMELASAGQASDQDGDFDFKNRNVNAVLSCIPQVVPFKQRVVVFHNLLEYDKYKNSNRRSGRGFILQVRRSCLIEDVFDKLQPQEQDRPKINLKGTMKIEFVDEAGIDGGGLFKDFIDNFTKEAFDPVSGFFNLTSEQTLTPNPRADLIREDYLSVYELFGKILGKAVYEKMLCEPQLAGGFLNSLLGRVNEIDDLRYLDTGLLKSLLNLEKVVEEGGDVSVADLKFEHEVEYYGERKVHELVPGGSSILVTNDNVKSFIHRKANFILNVETKEPCHAFLRGFRCLIPTEWIRMFDHNELQLLIGGDNISIDLKDLRRNTNYGGGYHDSQPYIESFWAVLSSFTFDEQSKFLKFVTSCPRQPLLGFNQIDPKFGIQKVPTYESAETMPKLPSASTCFNLLKLPQYDTVEQLREKILYSINSNSGFELS